MGSPERLAQQQTLLKALGNEQVTAEQKDAMRILDKIPYLTPKERKMLFYYYLWEQADGSFATIKKFGELREDIPLILDKVMDSDHLASAYEEFLIKYASRGKRALEFLKLLEEGVDPREAIEEMGLNFSEKVKGQTNQERFINFCKRVEIIESPEISDEEIAIALGESPTRIKRARKRLRDEGKARQRTPKEVSMANSRRFAFLRQQIKSADTKELVGETAERTGATRQQVLHQRAVLFRRGEIKRKTRDKTRQKLKLILENHLQENPPGTPINLSEIYRSGKLGVSWSTIQSLYHELKLTQNVPELKYHPRRKSGNV